MPAIIYTVTASIPASDPASAQATAREFLGWLTGGHTAEVIAGGATSASVVVLDPEPDEQAPPTRIETRYRFPSRAAFDAYEAGPAIPLREDGRSRFGGRVAFERRVGEVIQEDAQG